MPSTSYRLPTSLDWLGPFNGELCLWSQDRPGHTASVAHLSRVHSYRTSAQNLLLAAQAGHKMTPFFLGLILGDVSVMLLWIAIAAWQGRIGHQLMPV